MGAAPKTTRGALIKAGIFTVPSHRATTNWLFGPQTIFALPSLVTKTLHLLSGTRPNSGHNPDLAEVFTPKPKPITAAPAGRPFPETMIFRWRE